jgi:hypothetical protein
MLLRSVIVSLLVSSTAARGEPSENQMAHDAADFHKFLLVTLVAAAKVSEKHPGSNQGSEYIGTECRKLARRTSPDYIYGVFRDLSQDTSRTEDPYLVAEILVLAYPHKAARKVLEDLQKQPDANASEIQAWIEDMDRADQGKWE